jgi:hypothetical protein
MEKSPLQIRNKFSIRETNHNYRGEQKKLGRGTDKDYTEKISPWNKS